MTTFDADGMVIDAIWDVDDWDLAGGSVGDFSIQLTNSPDAVVESYRVQVEGYDAADHYYTSWDNYFDDIGTSSAFYDIAWLANEGITFGCGPGLYCPTGQVSRDQMASFLARAANLPATGTDYFTDDEGNTHQANINRIRAAGITTGCTATTYCPSGKVRRDQMASFLARAANLPATSTDYFSDDEGNTHEANINRIRAAGITTGCTATTYCPAGLVTRGQMASFLRRAFGD